jgi:hypothetical protein
MLTEEKALQLMLKRLLQDANYTSKHRYFNISNVYYQPNLLYKMQAYVDECLQKKKQLYINPHWPLYIVLHEKIFKSIGLEKLMHYVMYTNNYNAIVNTKLKDLYLKEYLTKPIPKDTINISNISEKIIIDDNDDDDDENGHDENGHDIEHDENDQCEKENHSKDHNGHNNDNNNDNDNDDINNYMIDDELHQIAIQAISSNYDTSNHAILSLIEYWKKQSMQSRSNHHIISPQQILEMFYTVLASRKQRIMK